MNKRILIIDDDADICAMLSRFLIKNGYDTETAFTANGGISKFQEGNFDLVLCDYRLGDKSGKEVMEALKKINDAVLVVIITGYSHIKTAVDVIKAGAYDYIAKPLIPHEVLNVIATALSHTLKSQVLPGKSTPPSKKKTVLVNFLEGKSKNAQELYRQVNIVAPTDYSVILYGETGTGKEVIARTIHERSSRSDKPFVAIDCGAISKELAGSTLFGHIKGAFTGAMFDKEGHFESANGGTIFLDEVANLSYETQATLLRVIQERKFKKVGGINEIPIDVRIIVASNESLSEISRNGKFRDDLYHRFNEFAINLPALRNRKDDIPLFASFFLEKSNKELNKTILGFEAQVMDLFLRYSWPGNLREFRNVIRRAVLLAKSDLITLAGLPPEMSGPVPTHESTMPESILQSSPKSHFALQEASSKAEYETIMNVLKDVHFNKSKAAKMLNIDRKTLYNKIRNYERTN